MVMLLRSEKKLLLIKFGQLTPELFQWLLLMSLSTCMITGYGMFSSPIVREFKTSHNSKQFMVEDGGKDNEPKGIKSWLFYFNSVFKCLQSFSIQDQVRHSSQFTLKALEKGRQAWDTSEFCSKPCSVFLIVQEKSTPDKRPVCPKILHFSLPRNCCFRTATIANLEFGPLKVRIRQKACLYCPGSCSKNAPMFMLLNLYFYPVHSKLLISKYLFNFMVCTEVFLVAGLAASFFICSTVNRKPGKCTLLQRSDLHSKFLNDECVFSMEVIKAVWVTIYENDCYNSSLYRLLK